ncbi:hypothetical protein [Shewanella sp. NIFS-20-20]|uniref:hypothetical protein n=1 Tax=Shewanella sp. NIFS-20-20 TaxID=2853806 RepID=UPI001C43A4E3|nr:hypothetical protein [Shewanella sp. NIFS-20-20]MBV7316269.1 hypothetical protein [Shewanella sp. NIFS-20-20]
MITRLIKRWRLRPSPLFSCQAQVLPRSPDNTWVLSKLNTPTMDFYFRSRRQQLPGYHELDASILPAPNSPLWHSPNSVLILVRDVPLSVLERLLVSPKRPAHIVWFMDDDIPGAGADPSLPDGYRRRLANWYQQAAPMLQQLCCQVWVSTAALAQKYQLTNDWILAPKQIVAEQLQFIRCFYHGSSSHTLEWQFMQTLVSAVQARYPQLSFELIGDIQVNKGFRHLPRVSILHPMSWPNYLALIQSRTMDIGLVPLFDSPFNRARSHCKLLDIARQGAIGIYSSRVSHSELIASNNAGLVVGDSVEEWLHAIDVAINADRRVIHQHSLNLINTLDT